MSMPLQASAKKRKRRTSIANGDVDWPAWVHFILVHPVAALIRVHMPAQVQAASPVDASISAAHAGQSAVGNRKGFRKPGPSFAMQCGVTGAAEASPLLFS